MFLVFIFCRLIVCICRVCILVIRNYAIITHYEGSWLLFFALWTLYYVIKNDVLILIINELVIVIVDVVVQYLSTMIFHLQLISSRIFRIRLFFILGSARRFPFIRRNLRFRLLRFFLKIVFINRFAIICLQNYSRWLQNLLLFVFVYLIMLLFFLLIVNPFCFLTLFSCLRSENSRLLYVGFRIFGDELGN